MTTILQQTINEFAENGKHTQIIKILKETPDFIIDVKQTFINACRGEQKETVKWIPYFTL